MWAAVKAGEAVTPPASSPSLRAKLSTSTLAAKVSWPMADITAAAAPELRAWAAAALLTLL